MMTIYFLVNSASCPYGQTWNVPTGWNDVLPVLYLDFDDLTCFTYVVGSSAVQISGKVCSPYKTLSELNSNYELLQKLETSESLFQNSDDTTRYNSGS